MNIQSSDLITELLCEEGESLHSPVHTEAVMHGFSVIRSDTDTCSYRTIVSGREDLYLSQKKKRLCTVLSEVLSEFVRRALPSGSPRSLAVGLGNPSVASDSLGAKAVARVPADGERIFTLTPLTKARTGLSSASLVREAARLARAEIIIAVDALAARFPERLGTVIQVSDNGISPGSGVFCATEEISTRTMPCPVISLGVPTVIRGDAIAVDDASLIVTPANVASLVESYSEIIGGGIAYALLH